MPPEVKVAMFHLDYISGFLTILATVLVGRKSWIGLLISIVNSMIVCIIGFRTSQFGFIPANLICICVYAFSLRSWVKQTHTHQTCAGSGKVRSIALRSTHIQTLGRTFTVPRTTLRRTRFPLVSASRQRKVTKNCRDYCNTVFQ
jgi:nicotinamide riboside transporter PnuC